MILKIIAEHGVHYRDGVAGMALWNEESQAKYVDKPPFGTYKRIMASDELVGQVVKEHEVMLSDDDTIIAYAWPTTEEELGIGGNFIDIRQISYFNKNGAPSEQEELYVDERCTVYLMSDEGKTVERLI